MTTLHCLPYGELPPELPADLQKVLDLPEEAQDNFWDVLEPNLAVTLDDRAATRTTKYCRSYSISPDDLAPAIKACRFLFLESAARNVPLDHFAEDLASITGNSSKLAQVLLPCYTQALSQLRQRILFAALAEHGKLITKVGWRIDTIAASDQGRDLRIPVGLLTIGYREGDRTDRITLQLLPEQIEQLRQACEDMLGKRE